MKKPAFIITFLILTIVILSMVKVVLYNRLSTSGVYVSKIENEISSYKTENAILSEKLLVSSSLTNISKKAKKEGFVRDNSLMVIKSSSPLAKSQ